MCEKFANLFYFLFGAGRAVVWMVQKDFDSVQNDPETCAMRRFDCGAQVGEQRFDFPPMNIGTGRFVIDALQQM